MRRLRLTTPFMCVLAVGCGELTRSFESDDEPNDDSQGGSESDIDGIACTRGCLAPAARIEFDDPILGGLLVGDFDGNGVDDLVSGAGIVLMRLQGLDFAPAIDLGTTDHQIIRFVADINGDGRSDLLGKDIVDSSLLVFLANAQGFEPVEIVALSSKHGPDGIDLFAEDFDGQGGDEVAVFTNSGRTLTILRRNGESDWTTLQTFTTIYERWVLTGGLVDDDEHVDLVAVRGAQAQVHLGLGDGTFAAPETFFAGADAIGAPFSSPVDAGLRGVVYTGDIGTLANFTAGVVTLWADDAIGITGRGFETNWPTDAVAIGDLHGDGCGDVVAVTDDGRGQPLLALLCGQADDYFDCGRISLAERPEMIAMLDIDENGLDDIVFVSVEQAHVLHVLLNTA
jgi:hypothetical protein